ncbi:MAG: hypothetical protein ACKO7P_10560 [Bacteroidota bacterium]|nr:hypothetical protein [Bacteroidota bacterium]
MTTYIQKLKNKSVRNAEMKLSKHRELGIKSPYNVFEVADFLDTIKNSDSNNSQAETIFFSVNMN